MGGTVTFAAFQAHRLGVTTGVTTRAAPELDVAASLPFARVVQLPADVTTSFENVYEDGRRRQRVSAQAAPIARDDVPAELREAPVALVGPVLGECAADLCDAFDERTLVGVSAQGWLRAIDEGGNVVRAPWEGPPFWRGASVLFVSDEDLADGLPELNVWTRDVPVVAMTRSRRGAQVWTEGRWLEMSAFPEDEVDPTGAGDTFATAFLIRLHETRDVAQAARFGAAAASLSVGGIGVDAIAGRDAIEARMREHPEVALG
jgi:hypothetical protein